LQGHGFKVDDVISLGGDCVSDSYGDVRQFFRSDDCKWLARSYLAVSKDNLGLVLVAISRVDMRGVAAAKKYKHLVDRWGTGNVTELSRQTGPYRSVRFNGKNYISGRERTAVWNAQAQPISPTPKEIIKAILAAARK
jgi:hypothetical protein